MPEDERLRMDMTICTEDFNSKPGEVINCDDVPDDLVNKYSLSPEKADLKRSIWLA